MKKEFTYEEFKKREMYDDLYPYDFFNKKENLAEDFVRLIFKAFNHGKMLKERGNIHKIIINKVSNNLFNIIFEMEINGEIHRI